MITLLQSIKARFSFVERIAFIQSSLDWRYVLGAAVLILLAGMINYDTRQSQWEHWQSNPNVFYADGAPLVSTTDAGYFLAYAENYQNGAKTNLFDNSRLYPDQTPAYRKANVKDPSKFVELEMKTRQYPLLSVIIAEVSDLFFDGDVMTAANAMIPFTALLTALAIGAMFWAAGYPAEGAIAATGFGLSASYLIRTSIGRIDTDQLIVFFVALTLTFILLAMRQRDYRQMLGFVLLAALSSSAFSWWYLQSLFVVLFPVITGIGIFFARLNWRPAAAGFGVFVLATKPLSFIDAVIDFAKTFIAKLFPSAAAPSPAADSATSLSFPDTFSTVTELARVDFLSQLYFMTSDILIGIIGCLGFIIFMIMRPSKGVIFLPFFMLGLLSVFLGRRFAFYGAPFVWFGAAWVFVSLSRLAAKYLNKKAMAKDANSFSTDGTVLTFSAIAVIMTAMISNIHYIPGPSFTSPVVGTMAQMRALEDDRKGIIASWWDYGYLAHYKSGMATLHDGGTQDTPRTHLIARGMISSNPAETLQIMKFIATEGNNGISANSASKKALNIAISKAAMPEEPIYLLLTEQMTGWFTTMARLGLFNTETGNYPPTDVLNGYHFYEFGCRPMDGSKFQCREGLIDLNHGTLDGKPLIKKSVETVDGRITTYLDYDNEGRFVLLIIRNQSGALRVKFIPQPTWESAFNQLYELGIYDENRLELVIDNYPQARVYKILR